MIVPRVAFLAADTMRSRAYAQALLARGIGLGRAMLITSTDRKRWGQAEGFDAGNLDFGPVFAPDLTIPLEESLARLAGSTSTLDAGTVNDPRVVAWLEDSGASVVIFSGFGGQIVKSGVLEAAPVLLHMHSGWLPDYRGSTTIYYSYLREGWCGVSAILLRESIDTGPIVARKRYPAPPPGAEVDYCYDSAIRADLLTTVIADWATHERFTDPTDQTPGAGRVYYIMHPVLKHVALNKIHEA
jgi:methionyl-tRNA formyltransferase